MKRIAIFCFFFWSVLISLYAQQIPDRTYGMLHGHTGYVVPQMGALPGGLEAPNGHFAFGSGGFGRLGRRWLLGGSGFGSTTAALGRDVVVKSNFGMGFADFGYVIKNRGRWHHHVVAGIGGGGYSVRYENTTENAFRLAENLGLDAGDKAKISAAGVAWQLGISLNRLLFAPEQQAAGAKLGLELGYFQFPVMSNWRYEGNDAVLNGPDKPNLQGFYVRLTLGGVW
jgi:hypothetical protein